jgi:hypothetical protein
MREEFLEYQYSLINKNYHIKTVFNWLNRIVDAKLRKDVKKYFSKTSNLATFQNQ